MATPRNANPHPNAPIATADTATAAFEAIRSAAGQATVVYFTKRTTGRERRMVLFYDEAKAARQRHRFNARKKQLLLVWDVEKGARRYVSLDAVRQVLAGGEVLFDSTERPFGEAPKKERPAKKRSSEGTPSFEKLQRLAKELF